jgi:hypothetical protein
MANDTDFVSEKVSSRIHLIKNNKSKYWKLRVYLPKTKKMRVISTKETTKAKALEFADSFKEENEDLISRTPPNHTLRHFAEILTELQKSKLKLGDMAKSTVYNDEVRMWKENGIVSVMGDIDVTASTPNDIILKFNEVIGSLSTSKVSNSTYNQYLNVLRKIYGVAENNGDIDFIPKLPKLRRSKVDEAKKTALDFSSNNNEWKRLREFVQGNVGKSYSVKRGNELKHYTIDEEFYELIMLLTHTGIRSTVNEIFSIKMKDIEVKSNPKRLVIFVKGGKTGRRYVDSTEAAVSSYERIISRRPDWDSEDYLLFPKYNKRLSAQKYYSPLFTAILKDLGMYEDDDGNKRTLYCLRHTYIQMRLIKSQGKVNIFSLAKNVGSSVEMIERFYAKHLPNSDEIAANLQSFGD